MGFGVSIFLCRMDIVCGMDIVKIHTEIPKPHTPTRKAAEWVGVPAVEVARDLVKSLFPSGSFVCRTDIA